jgi:cell division protein FtsQ
MNAAMTATLPAPLDVKLMNWTASLLFVGCVLGVLGACGLWLLRQPFFAIGQVAVYGSMDHISTASLRAGVAPQLGGNLFTVDLAAVRRAFEQVPWVRSAQVRREFPSSLRVQLQEHDVAAYWGQPGSGTLVDSDGQVFDVGSDDLELDLPRLLGARESAAELLRMYRALAPVLKALQSPIDALELTGHGGWRATLDSGAVIELGSGTQDVLLARARRLAGTLAAVAGQQGRGVDALEYADLRHGNGYALRLRGVTTLSSATPPARTPQPARPAAVPGKRRG